MFELVIVCLLVVSAATFYGLRLARGVRRASVPGCGPGCDGCSVSTPECREQRTSLPILVTLAAMLSSTSVLAADTVETWDAGALDVDFYLGYDGAGSPSRSVYGDIMVGYGIVDGFSAYLGTALAAPDTLAGGEPALYLGFFGTVVDTDHFDFDLFLDIGAGGEGMSELEVTPSLEVNVDATPDLGSVGAYVRAGLVARSASDSSRAVFDVVLNPGAYLTVAESQQLFVEYDMAIATSEKVAEIGGVALGYNLVLNDTVELITQVHADIPQAGETAAVSFMAGFIATIDGSAAAQPPRSLIASAE